MTRTVAEAVEWAREHPRKNVGAGGPSWSMWCAALVHWAGGFKGSFETAMEAGDKSGPLNKDFRTARYGDIHYWAGVGGFGHVGIDIGGTDKDRIILMASGAVTDSFGMAIGAVWFTRYAALGIPYRGHTPFWGKERLADSLLPGESSPATNAGKVPIFNIPDVPVKRKGSKMDKYFRRDSDGKLAVFGNGVLQFGKQEDYDAHRNILEMYAAKYPKAGIIVPPSSDNRENFFNLEDHNWNLEVAIHGGYIN